jgi:hypothetical protein
MSTVFVTLANNGYLSRAKRTIRDLRTTGRWSGQIVFVSVDGCSYDRQIEDGVVIIQFLRIDTRQLVAAIGVNGFPDTTDGRELSKIPQWEKLHVFDVYFKQWARVVFLDAGLRILDDVAPMLRYMAENNEKPMFWAPNDRGDGPIKQDKGFICQLSRGNPALLDSCAAEFGFDPREKGLYQDYFLNCVWIYDTAIDYDGTLKAELIETMNRYPLCKTNEMGVMNLVLHFRRGVWRPFPHKVDGKALFDWCELNTPGTCWRDYRMIKYSSTLGLEYDAV